MKRHNILGIIPARGGSKGIKDKNLYPICGFPLIAWTIKEAKRSRYISRLIISTDSIRIAQTAKKFGCEVPFMRPKRLAADNSSVSLAVLHAIRKLERLDFCFSHIVLLQPTSPLRTVEDIDKGIEFALNSNFRSVVGVSEAKHHPAITVAIDERGRLKSFLPRKYAFLQRQKFKKAYVINGLFYFAEKAYFLENKTFFTTETRAYVTNPDRAIDIDNLNDMSYAEFMLKKRLKSGDL